VLGRRLKFIIFWFAINFVPCVTRFDFETSPLTHDNQVAGALTRLEVLAGLIALVHVGSNMLDRLRQAAAEDVAYAKFFLSRKRINRTKILVG